MNSTIQELRDLGAQTKAAVNLEGWPNRRDTLRMADVCIAAAEIHNGLDGLRKNHWGGCKGGEHNNPCQCGAGIVNEEVARLQKLLRDATGGC